MQQDGQFKSTPKPNSQDPNLQVAQTLTDATLHLMNPKLKRTDATSNPTWAQEDTMDYQAPKDFALNPMATSPTVLAQVKRAVTIAMMPALTKIRPGRCTTIVGMAHGGLTLVTATAITARQVLGYMCRQAHHGIRPAIIRRSLGICRFYHREE